jgi:hypothetical protein
MDIISRKDALAQGLKHYFTGKPCKRGHFSHRFVSTRQCADCQNHNERTYYTEKPEYKAKRKAKAVKEYEEIKADPAKKAAYDERARKRGAVYRAENRELCNARSKASEAKKADEYRAKRVRWHRERIKRDPQYKATCALRGRVLQAVKRCGAAKSAFTKELLGCSYEQARQHLAAQFEPGMSWDNHGEWEIDHIRPCASFDLTDPAQQRECFHYTNLQPLWRFDNRSKNARLDWAKAA